MTKSGQKREILLIEDDNNISGPLEWALESRNYGVTIISDGKKALDLIDSKKNPEFSLILLDLMLPGANGWEILIKLKSSSYFSKIPVIIISAIDDESSETRALFDGADDYITKPFSMNVLLARIDTNIRKTGTSILDTMNLYFTDGNFGNLSNREKEILTYIVKGYSNKEIAQKEFINEITVGNHISRILQKLRVSSRTQAAILALKYNLVES